ncbi:MAG: reverse transcriptase domain-containing protein [Pseudomonadota bacterium]
MPHVSLLAIPVSVRQSQLHLSRPVFDLRSSNVENFLSALSQCSWSFLTDDLLNVNEKCDIFHSILNDVFTRTIPVKYVTFTNNTKPWITPLIKSLINERWNAYRQKNFQTYNHLKSKVKKEIEKSKAIWASKMKKINIWKVTNGILGRKSSDPMKCFYSHFDSVLSAADSINQGFAAVFSKKESVHVPLTNLNRITVTEYQVNKLLKNLPSHKASPEIPPKLYKAAADILALPLTILFKQSIAKSVVPDFWKISAVTPLPKTNSPSSTDELRPISLLPIPSKILERIILDYARPYFIQGYGDDQYGFRKGSSTTCALITLHDHITRSLDNTEITGIQVIAYDFSKAFDRIKHDIIIKRLENCNMPPELISWLESYLENRKQFVRIGSVCSSLIDVTSGVPQGSVLGPFIFSAVVGSLKVSNRDCCIIK